MSEPRALVEHFFRHEFGRLGAVLTRWLGWTPQLIEHLHRWIATRGARRGVEALA